LIAVLGIFASVETIKLDVEPANARVLLPETLLWFRSRAHLYVFAGKHTVRAEHAGYRGAQTSVVVDHDSEPVARVRLLKLPGVLSIDTKGVQATVFIDGAATGLAPGSVSAPAGTHTLTVRAPRYLDFIQTLAIEGGGRQQRIAVSLVPSWGTLVIAAEPKSARIRIDGAESGIAPASLDLQVGIHHVSLLAPGYRPWESSLVIRPGERLSIGPVRLGAPDAQLNVRSRPAGAEVSVAGSFRGRTPLRVALAPGVQYEVVVSLPGHSSYFESVFAEAGATLSVDATLPGSAANLKISGDPPGAEVFVDGVPRGKAPQSLSLDTVEHRIEVRKEGYVPYAVTLAASPGLERQVNYRLASQERSIALQESAATVTANIGYALRLIPGGSFQMGSERREQGRRPNEGFRRISLRRPFYIGISEVTNAEFRRFRAAHTSGFIDKHSLDLDEQPVVQVSWDDAAEFCNWLSAEDGLPPAYIDRDGKHSLVQPVTRGYRLPTEAEWEYAARYAAADQFRRFSWGDTLPVPGGSGNLAGSEAAASLPATLEGYRDTFAVTAPVRRFQPTPLGLYDFTGNVSEWVNDRYLSFVDSAAANDPLGPQEGSRHVIRGANWQSAAVADLRLAWRDGADAPSRVLGFRVARYAE
jgi:formylglycine-generating enzyme required for sulfatase activity